MRIERVVVVGAGAMGCFFAARLAEADAEVTLIDVDDPRLASLAAEGITIDDDHGSRIVPVAAERAESVADTADLIVVFTKGAHTAAAIASVAHIVGPETLALTLQNGVGNAEAIADVIPGPQVVMGITDIPCDLVGPTAVASHGSGHITLGGFDGAEQAGSEAVRDLLARAGLHVTHDPQVRIAVWEKIAFNAAMNSFCAVTMLPVGGLDNEPGRRVIGAIVGEVVAVAQAIGLAVNPTAIAAKIDNAIANHVHHKPSMLQDRLAGRKTEIETINGAVVAAGDAAGIAVPVNRTMADLVRTLEAASGMSTHSGV